MMNVSDIELYNLRAVLMTNRGRLAGVHVHGISADIFARLPGKRETNACSTWKKFGRYIVFFLAQEKGTK